VIVTRTTEDHFEAVNAKCPHEGNRVRAANSEGLLICEAHESTFQPDGTYIEGPATDDFGNGLNLKRYETAFDGEGTVTIEIDELSSVSSRESGEEFIALHSTGPLPSSSVFRYRIVGAGHATLSIWSLDGRELLRPLDEWVESGEGHISVDLSSLARGLYLYRFHVSGRPVGTGRVIVPQ
jgi:nitrite reductase/ring-hydroxylating ferredoxin subunit